MLRAYYAWKNGLPFSYSTAVTPLGYSKDIRYTARGNVISSRRDLVDAGLDARRAIPQIVDTISSAHYRYPPAYTGRLLPDHYPVKIARDSIKPGTIIYDPNGHVAVIYKVTAEGRIHYIDTHPDNSLIHKRPQPDRLPNNIYGTDGDWETYSTPSRDARLKTAFKELRDEVARFLTLASAGSNRLAYAGEDIRGDIRQVYLQETRACTITYVRSDGSERQLPFAEVERRLYALSFDPHHCAERRWGAHESEELATCADPADKRARYEAEQRLRNQPDRTYDVRMGFSLVDLRRAVAGSGIDQPPGTDVLALLAGDAPPPGEAGGLIRASDSAPSMSRTQPAQ
jgi:hypothetical protein